MEVPICLISLNLIFSADILKIQGSCLSLELERSEQAAGPSAIQLPSSGITSLLTSDSLTLELPLNFKLVFLP